MLIVPSFSTSVPTLSEDPFVIVNVDVLPSCNSADNVIVVVVLIVKDVPLLNEMPFA